MSQTAAKQAGDFLVRTQFQVLLDVLQNAGYRCIGPQVSDGAIVYANISRSEQLPRGMVDEQGPGHYTVRDTGSVRYFQWATGPQGLKPQLFAPRETRWQVKRDPQGHLQFRTPHYPQEKTAVIGVRGCDLAALRLQDQHFLEGETADEAYRVRRNSLFLVAINCGHSAATCFCHSTGDGPEAGTGYDLLLSELDEGFIIAASTAAGEAICAQLPLQSASDSQHACAKQEIAVAADQQSRRLPKGSLRDRLYSRLEHPRWSEVAARCLSCGNCTAVCPTCFCHSELEQPALDGESSEHIRQWDSCFTSGHSYMHGMILREDTRKRYRQWLTHKLAGWHDQYGRCGCVGCGRCISWCPVGIDLTEEMAVICQESADDR